MWKEISAVAKISIVIPVYNIAKYMDKCMESVLGQTLSDIEIILVDDGSTDGVSPQKCDEYAQKDKRVKVIHKENGGLMSAWIEGTVEATSEYVSYVDSDDWIDLDMMEKYYEHIDGAYTNSQVISGNCTIEKAGKQRLVTSALTPGEYIKEPLEEVKYKLLGRENRTVIMSRCMKLISRKLVLENMKYCNPTITMGEDINITLPCLCDAKRLVILEGNHSYHYRQVAGSISHAYNPKLFANLELTDKTFREILNDKKIQNADQQMDAEFVMMLLIIMRNELRCEDRDTLARVKKIFLRPDIKNIIAKTEVDIKDKANMILYFVAKHPNAVTVSFAKALITAFDKRTN